MALVSLSSIKEMLAKCAPGHKVVLKTHNWHIFFNGLSYRALPKYEDIEEFHVRKIGRSLKIEDCVKRFYGF